jgi:hypothetical protein
MNKSKNTFKFPTKPLSKKFYGLSVRRFICRECRYQQPTIDTFDEDKNEIIVKINPGEVHARNCKYYEQTKT